MITSVRQHEPSTRPVHIKSFNETMKTWPEAVCDGMISGGITSISTTIVLGCCGQHENGSPYSSTNAISHWVWGDDAARKDGPSTRYTFLGYAIHHASAVFWAIFYEKWFGKTAERQAVVPAVAGGAAVAALACFVDYKVTPKRLHPGYEKRLSKRSLFLVYAVFGLTVGLRALTSRIRQGG
jgi:hypothetical protein